VTRKKRARVHGFLAVDAKTGREYFMSAEETCSEVVAEYLYRVTCIRQEAGCSKIVVYLDNNPTHQEKMRDELEKRLNGCEKLAGMEVEVKYLPKYSPDFNVLESLIHQVRLKLLHHLPAQVTIGEVEKILYDFFNQKQLHTAEQIGHIINHILPLGGIHEPSISPI
jgi:hypothetical protein